MLLAFAADTNAIYFLAAGLAGLLVAVLVAAKGLIPDNQPAPTRRAIAHFLPIAAASTIALLLHRPEIALGIVFGTSVALLSSVTGFVILSAPIQEFPLSARRLWPFLTVTTLLVFLIGFSGPLTPKDAVLLLVQCILGLLLWTHWREPAPKTDPTLSPLGLLESAIAILLAIFAAYAAVRGASRFAAADPRFPTAVMASTLFSVVLALPMVTTGVPAAAAGRAHAAITGQIGVVFLNLTLLLPTLILLSSFPIPIYLNSLLSPTTRPLPSTLPATRPLAAEPSATPPAIIYPRVAWRIDSVALLILSLLLMAVADRRIKLSAVIASALILSYLVYLVLIMYLTRLSN